MDRNDEKTGEFIEDKEVALLAEGVDRNSNWVMDTKIGNNVALLAEGVDRNENEKENIFDGISSPSSRRAWIEIKLFVNILPLYGVALLAEGVDRNLRSGISKP